MENYRYYAEEIKSRIKMPEMLKFYGVEIDKNNRIACPIHKGVDKNCGVKEEYIYCFVCNESADQIELVKILFGLPFREAVEKINRDFLLELPIGEKITLRQKRQIERRYNERLRQAEQKKAEKEKMYNECWAAFDKFTRLEKIKTENIPKSKEEEFDPSYAEALHQIDLALFNLEIAEMRLMDYEHR